MASTSTSETKSQTSVRATPHFVTGNYQSHATFLPDKDYAMVLDNVVKATNDMILTHQGKILLGKRRVFPQKGWWFGCGGRMTPGESVFKATSRLLKRELSIEVSEQAMQQRLQTVGHYSFLWEMRDQEPKNHGTADISVIVTMELTEQEVSNMKLDACEYEDRSWISPEDIVNGSYHAALVRAVNEYIKLLKFQALEKLVNATDAQDQDIAKLVKDYVRFSASISQNDTAAVVCKDGD